MLGRLWRPARGCDPALRAARPGQPASGADAGEGDSKKLELESEPGEERMIFSPADYINRAKSIESGHLSIGRGGFTLHFAEGSTLSGYDIDRMKTLCIDAGLPVIDSRCVEFDKVAELAISGPMVAVGSAPKFFLSRAFSHVSLVEWVASYRAAGAEIHNMPEVSHEPAS
jgi:hypothetical protein